MTSNTPTETATILDGKAVSQKLIANLKAEIETLKASGTTALPKLVVILVGDDPASRVYTKRKTKVAKEIGMESELLVLDANTSEESLTKTVQDLNNDESVNAILIQLPLPKQINTERVLAKVSPAKDVDGFHPQNLGQLLAGSPMPTALPCTPAGIMTILKDYNIPIEGKHAVVIGRSSIVGKPISLLLLSKNATVTLCHSRTQNLANICRQADILVAAVGRPEMVDASMIKPGAVVIDVGINRLTEGERTGKLVGDVNFEAAKKIASHITPVPGGVGPMTIATLMQNTIALFKHQHGQAK